MSLRNNLIAGEGGIFSTRPLKYLEKLSRMAALEQELTELLCSESLEQIRQTMSRYPEFQFHFQRFLSEYGQRCHESLLIESPNIADEPHRVLQSIGYQARRISQHETKEQIISSLQAFNITQPSARELAIRAEAEALVAEKLAGHPIRKIIFAWVLKQARQCNRDRENMRFIQTRITGQFRLILRNLGRCFVEKNLLNKIEDIYDLTLEDITGFVEGNTACGNLRGLAALRRQELDLYKTQDEPPHCFETKGSAFLGRISTIYTLEGCIELDENGKPSYNAELIEEEYLKSGDTRKGTGCSPGKVQGPVVFLEQNGTAQLTGKEILIAEIGDPGLVMYFSAVAGVVFEKGSPLSHLAIVAREMGIPAIVSVTGINSWIQAGDWVELDGQTGMVRKLTPEP